MGAKSGGPIWHDLVQLRSSMAGRKAVVYSEARRMGDRRARRATPRMVEDPRPSLFAVASELWRTGVAVRGGWP